MHRTLNLDQWNIILMVAACAAAFFLPFEVLLFSYAILGPAHYLTQISWMHDRSYFTAHRNLWIPASALVLLLMVMWDTGGFLGLIDWPSERIQISNYIAFAFAVSAAAALALVREIKGQIILGFFIMTAFLVMKGVLPAIALPLVLLIPTVLHVYVFTGAFILQGAIRASSLWGYISFGVFIGCALLFWVLPPEPRMIMPEYAMNNIVFFDGAAAYLTQLLSFGGTIDGVAVLGFLSFAYTYHYLNWFSKVEVIKWHNIPRRRLMVIIALFFASISLYIYDYRLGFIALLFLSLLHVLLELPLNAITFRSIGRSLGRSLGQLAVSLFHAPRRKQD